MTARKENSYFHPEDIFRFGKYLLENYRFQHKELYGIIVQKSYINLIRFVIFTTIIFTSALLYRVTVYTRLESKQIIRIVFAVLK